MVMAQVSFWFEVMVDMYFIVDVVMNFFVAVRDARPNILLAGGCEEGSRFAHQSTGPLGRISDSRVVSTGTP